MTGFISADQKNLYTFIFERKGRGSKMDMEDTSKLKIFTGNAHPALAKEISDYIGVPLGKAICGRFNNGEIQVMINAVSYTHLTLPTICSV